MNRNPAPSPRIRRPTRARTRTRMHPAPERPPILARLCSLPQRALMLLVRAYRLLLKPWLGQACRFEPSCSAYTLEALQRHGAAGGVLLGGWRLLRCQPWCQGGCDPVPERHPLRGLFTRLFATAAPAAAESPSSNRNLP